MNKDLFVNWHDSSLLTVHITEDDVKAQYEQKYGHAPDEEVIRTLDIKALKSVLVQTANETLQEML